MFAIAKVLCPVDFSAAAVASVGVARSLAVTYGAQLYLLNVLEVPAPAEGSGDPARAEAARESVRARLSELAAADGRQPVETHLLVSDGAPAEEILRMEELFGIDLIVLAPHGRPTLGKIIFGSVTDKVTRGAHAHVFLVKPPAEDGGTPVSA